MAIEIENEQLLRNWMATRNYTLFAGAGFSTQASGERGSLPVGAQLAEMLRVEYEIDPTKRLSLPQIYTIAERNYPSRLRAFIEETYTATKFSLKYNFLREVPPKSILTTNVDDLFQQIFNNHPAYYLNDVFNSGSAALDRSAIDLVQVHGSIRDSSRPFVFGPFDLASAATTDPDRWHFVRQRVTATPTLFWGYGFSDSGTLQAMRSHTGLREAEGEAWVQIRPSDRDGLIDFYRSLDFSVIVADTDELLDYFVQKPVKVEGALPTKVRTGNIPSASEVPTRPIEDFFAGAAPVWSDIWSGKIHRTSHYRAIAEQIAGGSHVVLAGIPGCGKTTLLMQLAATLSTGHDLRFFLENLSVAEATLAKTEIGGQSALIFLDNVASDVRVLNVFSSMANVQIVAADRDLAINSVGDRVLSLGNQVLGVTGLTRPDMVSIWKSLPQRSRTRDLIEPRTEKGISPSVYELVRLNVKSESLSRRLLDYLREIVVTEPDLAELLLLACYLMYARSVLSSDVALAYFRDEDIAYEDVIAMVHSVGDLLHEANVELQDQDYFTARSAMVAEEILEGSPSGLLREVLLKFHDNVSSLRIFRFDVFRRRAYDARLMGQAFRSYQEAVDLYDDIMEKDPSAWVLQQKALFQSKRAQHEGAFRTAEEARESWHGRANWTIESTYFKVLFSANIVKSGTWNEAISLCSRALDGLRSCFLYDKRQGQHAVIYADCALKYSEVEAVPVGDAVSRLREAANMLTRVIKSEPYLQAPRRLLPIVERRVLRLE